MSSTFKAACIQNCATGDVNENIEITTRLTREAAAAGANLICLPEYFSGLTTDNGKIHPVHFPEAEHPVIPAFAKEARSLGVSILLGSLGVTAPDGRINQNFAQDLKDAGVPEDGTVYFLCRSGVRSLAAAHAAASAGYRRG